MNELSRLIESIECWQKRNWNKVGVCKKYRKLLEEVGELGEALILQDKLKVEIEAGDVAIVLIGLLQEQGIRLQEALFEAHRKNVDREQGKGE